MLKKLVALQVSELLRSREYSIMIISRYPFAKWVVFYLTLGSSIYSAQGGGRTGLAAVVKQMKDYVSVKNGGDGKGSSTWEVVQKCQERRFLGHHHFHAAYESKSSKGKSKTSKSGPSLEGSKKEGYPYHPSKSKGKGSSKSSGTYTGRDQVVVR